MHKVYELKDKLCDELEEYGDKKLDAGSLEVIDKLAHTIKNLDKIIEKYEDEDYSSAYNDGMSYEGGSYEGGAYERDGNRGGYSPRYAMARGRGRNARRDSMGRYSSDNRMMVEELRDLMNDAPDERTKMEFKRFIEKMEQM
jgi:hypothetical protein